MFSSNLGLPYLAAAQAQKHVTLNEALLRLDALVQGNVLSRVTAAEPASPADGALYILPAGKTGTNWGAMTTNALAYYRDGVWENIAPREGWTVYVRDEDLHVVFNGAVWTPLATQNSLTGVFRNRLMNAAFAINQRAAASSADDTYCFDRWYVLTQTGAIAAAALTDPEAGRPTGVRLTQSQATAQRIGVAQIVEAANIKDLRSQAAAMAARVRCSAAQTIRMAILEWTGTADAVTSDVVNSWTSATYTPGNFFIAGVNVIALGATTPAANTWADMAPISGSFGAGLNNAIVLVWTESVLAQNATLDLTQAQLEPGACGAFARRSFGEELALCQRYYWRRNVTSAYGAFGMVAIFSSTSATLILPHAVRMRAVPVCAISNVEIYDGIVQAAATLAGQAYSTPDMSSLTLGGAGMTAGRPGLVEAANNSSAYIEGSVEL